ncbi:beta-propeller fold lactonase family protein [Novosphingobium flavum]|uniref:Beta-propeller fold lactonase family protein n=1 Tax=Novosphingobium flavum TaxID=1778672 RepID=A0A7X1KL75_9SPHN|nr:beta-propeller fold lactonase family protein [Novosphingobium flavum]MBC2665306.1 beta-propeller fold lactonase family protein [Novosphingobium flavum]
MTGETLAPDSVAGAAARPLSAYVAVGAELINFTLDGETGALRRRGSIRLPSRIQYAWPHGKLPILYVACADRAPGADGQPFYLCALTRDDLGDCTLLGEPALLPARPIDLTVAPDDRFVLTAYSQPAAVTVHRLAVDGSLDGEVVQEAAFAVGSAPHQVKVMPSGDRVVICARGKKGFGKDSYVSGSLELLSFADGQLAHAGSVIPELPRGFNPRALEFHPDHPLVYVALEEQSQLCVLPREGDSIGDEALHLLETLAEPDNRRPRQDGGAIHLHPAGHTVYVGNRNDGYVGGQSGPSWLVPDPVPVFAGGENSIAVFALDPATGAPRAAGHAPSGGLHPRTFAPTPDGRWLIVANLAPTIVADADGRLTEVPANLTVFAVGDDGLLTEDSRQDIDVAGEMIWWMGLA